MSISLDAMTGEMDSNAATGPGLAGSGDLASEASYEPDRQALASARETTIATQETAADRENPEPDCL